MPTAAELHIAKFNVAKIKNPETGVLSSAYELQLLQLRSDRLRLKSLESVEAKIELKRQLIPAYEAWINGVLEAGTGTQDDVFMHLLVWTLDVGDLKKAYAMADYALKYELVTPDQYVRKTASLIAEEVANTALKLYLSGDIVDSQILLDYIELLKKNDMSDQIRAKLFKAAGLFLETKNPEAAIIHLERALVLDAKCGVKKQLDSIKRKVKKSDS